MGSKPTGGCYAPVDSVATRPQDVGDTPFMSLHEVPCPIWENASNAVYMIDNYFIRQRADPSKIHAGKHAMPCDSPRAGGHFKLNMPGAKLLPSLTNRQRANLSYWIYHHNHPSYLLFGASPDQEVEPPVLDEEWVERHRDRTPSSSDRVLTYLCELIRSANAGQRPDSRLKQAAGGCWNARTLRELQTYAASRGWLGQETGDAANQPERINLSGRIHVEEQLRKRGKDKNGFVAMWFADCMNEVYEDGIKPAIDDAGYEPVRIDRQEFLGNVPDEILAEIRQSRFVVADFTACKQCTACKMCKKIGAPGGVYYEAGFARGLDIPVIHTVHEDCMDDVHFDTSPINHITWETSADLRTKLQHRIEATLGRGPLHLPNSDH